MGANVRKALDEYLAREYPFNVIASKDGGYVIAFPDLPGCITQADTPGEVGTMAEDAKRAWIEAAYEDGEAIPEPTLEDSYSGRLVVRMPRSLHRALAQQAECEGVSLNQYLVALLASRQGWTSGAANPSGAPAAESTPPTPRRPRARTSTALRRPV